MSRFSTEYLNRYTLNGFTDKRGHAWHRDITNPATLLNSFPGAIPMDRLVGDNGLFGFQIVDAPIYVQIDGVMLPVDGRKAQVRTDNGAVMGIHSDRYTGHDYSKWLVDNLSKLTGNGTDFANAGLLNDGAQGWVQIEMPENIGIAGGVIVRPFLLAQTSFDGSLATTYKTGFTNVVCDNTHAMFMREAGETYKRRHTSKSEFDLLSAADALNTLYAVAENVTADIERLLAADVSDSAWSKFITAHVPTENEKGEALSARSIALADTKRQALTGLYRTDIRVAPWAGTAWGVMQAVNTYNEHLSIVRNVDPYERKMTRAVKGQTLADDRSALVTLAGVLNRGDLLSV